MSTLRDFAEDLIVSKESQPQDNKDEESQQDIEIAKDSKAMARPDHDHSLFGIVDNKYEVCVQPSVTQSQAWHDIYQVASTLGTSDLHVVQMCKKQLVSICPCRSAKMANRTRLTSALSFVAFQRT